MADSPRMLEMVRRCAKRQRRRAAVHARCRALLRPRPRVRVFHGHSPRSSEVVTEVRPSVG